MTLILKRKYATTGETAEVFHVTPRTIYRRIHEGRFRRAGPLFPFVIAMGPKGRTRTPTGSPRHPLKVRRVGPQSDLLLNTRNRINGEVPPPTSSG